MARKALAEGLFKGEFQEDVTRLFNPDTVLKLIEMEETESDHVFGKVATKIRSIWPKLTIGYLSFYVVLAITIVSLALSRGIPPIKCFALVFSICKIFVDYDKYLKESKLRQTPPNTYEDPERTPGFKHHKADVEEVVGNNLISLNTILTRLEDVEIRLEQLEFPGASRHRFEIEDAEPRPHSALSFPRRLKH